MPLALRAVEFDTRLMDLGEVRCVLLVLLVEPGEHEEGFDEPGHALYLGQEACHRLIDRRRVRQRAAQMLADGRQALSALFGELGPAEVEIHRVIAEGDFVVAHSYHKPPNSAVVDIWRFSDHALLSRFGDLSVMTTTTAAARRTLAATLVAAALTAVAAVPATAATPSAATARHAGHHVAAGHGESARLAYQKSVAVTVLKGLFERGDTEVVDRYVLPGLHPAQPDAP
ncbi:hypothetical protein [Streptomyces sp. NPDC000618]|uniref:hypothetical protein n=1 Tax=Streptomyces sp. NPDC000618 TaxID=3154265 RepID=UPI00331B8C4D